MAVLHGFSGDGDPPPRPIDVDLHTRWLVLPEKISVGREEVLAYRIGIVGEIARTGSSDVTLHVHDEPATLDDFGDFVAGGRSRAYEVEVRPLDPEQEPESDRLPRRHADDGSRIVFEVIHGGEASGLQLVLTVEGQQRHRLVCRDDRRFRRWTLHGAPSVSAPVPATPLDPRSFDLRGDEMHDGRVTTVRLRATNGHVTLTHDRNLMGFDHYGEMGGGTLIAFMPLDVVLIPIDDVDPTGQGRLRYRVVNPNHREQPRHSILPAAKRYELVLGRTHAADHRLLVHREKLVQVIPLVDANRAPPKRIEP